MNHEDGTHNQGRLRIPFWIAVCGFLAIVVLFLWTEHRAHLFGALPYLIVLACPLLHRFMHHGHGGHDDGHERTRSHEHGGKS